MLRNTADYIYTAGDTSQYQFLGVRHTRNQSSNQSFLLKSPQKVQVAWCTSSWKIKHMTAEKQEKANKLLDVSILESLTLRVEQLEAKRQKMQLLQQQQLVAEQERRMELEQKLLELQEKVESNGNKYQETIGWVDELEDKLRQEQQQQKLHVRKLMELCEKFKTLEKECNHWHLQASEEGRQRCEYLEKRVRDLEDEDKSQSKAMVDISGMLENCTMEEALHQAAANGDTATVRLLVSRGANVHARIEDMKTFDDPTPLHLAAAAGHESTVFALLESSAHVNARAYVSATPLLCAAKGRHLGVCQQLLKFGADVNCRNSKNMTPLHYACSLGSWTLVQLFVDNGANLTARVHNKTPADVAASEGHVHLAKYLRSKVAQRH